VATLYHVRGTRPVLINCTFIDNERAQFGGTVHYAQATENSGKGTCTCLVDKTALEFLAAH